MMTEDEIIEFKERCDRLLNNPDCFIGVKDYCTCSIIHCVLKTILDNDRDWLDAIYKIWGEK